MAVKITAAAVKALREKTGLPMMECKRALVDSEGDEALAIETLRKAGKAKMEGRAGRSTEEGRISLFIDKEKNTGAIIEILCESAQVGTHPEYIALADALAQQLASGPGAATPEELLAQQSPVKDETLQATFDDLNNRIREVFRLNRIARIDGTCAGYVHHNAAAAVLLQVEGDNEELAKDVCMHTVAMRPAAFSKADVSEADIEKEREILTAAAIAEGKPESIAEKMVEGRMKNFFADHCMTEQPFVKDDSKTVAQAAKDGGLKLIQMTHWELGK